MNFELLHNLMHSISKASLSYHCVHVAPQFLHTHTLFLSASHDLSAHYLGFSRALCLLHIHPYARKHVVCTCTCMHMHSYTHRNRNMHACLHSYTRACTQAYQAEAYTHIPYQHKHKQTYTRMRLCYKIFTLHLHHSITPNCVISSSLHPPSPAGFPYSLSLIIARQIMTISRRR